MTERVVSLFRLMSRVAAAESEAEVLSVVVDEGVVVAGAAAGVVGWIEGDAVRVVAEHGYPAGYLDSWRTFPLEPGRPMADVVTSGQSVYCGSREERDSRWPLFQGTGIESSEAFVVVPLVGRGGVVGALTLSYLDKREFEGDERAFLEALAAQCALALERTRAAEAERRLTTWLGFLSEAGSRLGRSLDYGETLAEVGRLVVPTLADWFACDLLVDGHVELVAVSHVDPGKVSWARELREKSPPDMDAPTGLPNVLRTGQSELYEVITDEMIEASAATPDELELIQEIGFSSAMVVPLIARGQTLGALTLVWAESGRHYGQEDIDRAEELAARVAGAIDNSRLYEAQRVARARTERLQRFTARLAPALTIESVTEIAIDKALIASGGKTALLGLATADGKNIEVTTVGDGFSDEMESLRVVPRDHASVLGEVFRRNEPLWLGTRAEWEEYPEAIGRPASLQAVAVLPVATTTRFFGVLGIAFDHERQFPDEERRFLMAIAGQTAQALDRAALYEEQSHIAEVLQQSLLPGKVPAIPGIELATSYRAAGRMNLTGGDFYDVFETPSAYAVVIGDVCGKGPSAAALTALCRYTLRACALSRPDAGPADLLRLLNRAIVEHASSDDKLDNEFASVTCILLDSSDGRVVARLASGGHPPTLLQRNGTIEEHRATGPLVGLFENAVYGEYTINLEPGDLVVLHTDGLTDARSDTGERLGEPPIRSSLLADNRNEHPHAVTETLMSLLEGFEITDDIAIVVLHVSDPVATVTEPYDSRKVTHPPGRPTP